MGIPVESCKNWEPEWWLWWWQWWWRTANDSSETTMTRVDLLVFVFVSLMWRTGQWFIREVDDYNKGLDSIAVSVFVQNLRRVGLSTRVDLLHCTHPPCGNNQATYWRKIQPSNILERLAGGNGWMSTICSFIEIQFQCFVVGLNSLAGWSLCCDKQPVVASTDSHLHVLLVLLVLIVPLVQGVFLTGTPLKSMENLG